MDVMSRHTPASRDFVAGRERSERREFTLRQLRDWAYSERCEWNEQSERMENRANAVSNDEPWNEVNTLPKHNK